MTEPRFLNAGPTGMAGSLLTSRPVTDGEPVSAAVTNRLPVTNSINTAWLHELLKRLHDNSGEFLWGVPIAPDVVVGDFVYYDGTDGRFAKALARYVVHDGRFHESETAAIWGVVTGIDHNEANLCTGGLCTFRAERTEYQLDPDPGVRYLSDRTAGAPTVEPVRPEKCLGCLVGVKATGDVQFFVRPSLTSDPGIHRHESWELAAVPAGTCFRSQPNAITSVQADRHGWVPATHAIFAGKAPSDAYYGYNPVTFQTGCRRPLRFAENAGLRWQRHLSDSDDPLLASVPPELYRIDETTIWWLTDKAGVLPWDSRFDYAAGEPENVPDESYRFRMWLDFVNTGYGLTDGIVSSLRTREGSGLHITQYPFGGGAATGDLLLDFDFRFRPGKTNDWSGHAVKALDHYDVTTGPVVSGLQIDSRLVRVVRSDFSEDQVHYGRVVLGDPTGQIGQELPFEAVHLNGVEESVEREAIGLAFPATRESSLLARIVVPLSETFSAFRLSLFFGVLVTRSGNLTTDLLKLNYRILSNPAARNTIVPAFPQPALDRLDCDFTVQNNRYSTGYFTAESDAIPVRPGDLVLLKIERTPPDHFNDRVILLRKSAILHLA